MASFCEVFERKEKKYRLSAQQYKQILAALAGHMQADAFGNTEVSSLYFDTPHWELIERSLDKPLYKEKLRMRRYNAQDVQAESGSQDAKCNRTVTFCETSSAQKQDAECNRTVTFSDAQTNIQGNTQTDEQTNAQGNSQTNTQSDRVFIELKKKFKGIVYKRRLSCSDAAARAYFAGMPYEQACSKFPLENAEQAQDSLKPRSLQIAREIDAFRTRYEQLTPSMVIICNRAAYAPISADEEGLRITFDTNLRYENKRARHAATSAILAPGEAIMEIKSAGALPLWLTSTLTQLCIFPCSFSKYGTAYSLCIGNASVNPSSRAVGAARGSFSSVAGTYRKVEGAHQQGRQKEKRAVA